MKSQRTSQEAQKETLISCNQRAKKTRRLHPSLKYKSDREGKKSEFSNPSRLLPCLGKKKMVPKTWIGMPNDIITISFVPHFFYQIFFHLVLFLFSLKNFLYYLFQWESVTNTLFQVLFIYIPFSSLFSPLNIFTRYLCLGR